MFTRDILLHLKLIEKQSRILFKKKASKTQRVNCVPINQFYLDGKHT